MFLTVVVIIIEPGFEFGEPRSVNFFLLRLRIKDRFRSVNLVKLLVCVKIENCERMVVNGNRVDGEVEVAAHGLFLHHDVVEVLVVECASLALPPRWP